MAEYQVGRNRSGAIEPRLAKFSFDMKLSGKCKPAVGLHAHITGSPTCFGGEVLGHVRLCAAGLVGVVKCGGMVDH